MPPTADLSQPNRAVALANEFLTRVWGPTHDLDTEILETFANAEGDRVTSRWYNTGVNNGIFGVPPDGRPVNFTGIAIWSVRDGRLAECWVERASFESYQRLTA